MFGRCKRQNQISSRKGGHERREAAIYYSGLNDGLKLHLRWSRRFRCGGWLRHRSRGGCRCRRTCNNCRGKHQ